MDWSNFVFLFLFSKMHYKFEIMFHDFFSLFFSRQIKVHLIKSALVETKCMILRDEQLLTKTIETFREIYH